MNAGMPTTIEGMMEAIERMTPQERQQVEAITAVERSKPWIPQAGPQMAAYHHEADELLYGGAAGGGKTDLALGLCLTAHKRSLLFRRQSTDLEGIWERLEELTLNEETGFDIQKSKNSVKKKMTTTDGRTIEMGHLEVRDSEKTWQGRPHDFIGFDEAAQLDEAKIMFVSQWLRTTEAGQRCRIMFATNPPIPDMKNGALVDVSTGDWMKRWFAPWIDDKYANPAKDGELRWCVMRQNGAKIETVWVDGAGWYNVDTGEEWDNPTPEDKEKHGLAQARSRTFVRSLVQDNVFLKDSGYAERLSSTPEPLRSMLLRGVFGIKLEDHPFQVIPTAWVMMAQQRWLDRMAEYERDPNLHRARMAVLAADIAQGGMDNTTIVPLREDGMFDEISTFAGRDTPDGPAVVANLLPHRRDQALIVLDGGGGWGGDTMRTLKLQHKIDAQMFIASENQHRWSRDGRYKFLNNRADMWWGFREALNPETTDVVMLPPNDALTSQLTAPHWGLREKTIVVESKDDLRKRLGSSTDEADCVLMGWFYRDKAIAMHHSVSQVTVAEGGWNPNMVQADPRVSQADLDDPLADWDVQ